MKAQELRIGNYVNVFRTNGAPTEWVQIDIHCDHIYVCHSNPEWFEPILITEDWLNKFGFCQYGATPRMERFYYHLSDYFAFHLTIDRDDEIFYDSKIHLKYIHQLQNLYYALTGIELTIKEIHYEKSI